MSTKAETRTCPANNDVLFEKRREMGGKQQRVSAADKQIYRDCVPLENISKE